MKKPSFLSKKVDLTVNRKIKRLLKDLKINTVCDNSLCPNISECFKSSTLTFMILGDVCTRDCRFCGVKKSDKGIMIQDEDKKIVKAVRLLNLDYVVLTCVTRDDLSDAGTSQFVHVIRALRHEFKDEIMIEILVSDLFTFDATKAIIKKRISDILKQGVNVFGHNMEMVPSLYPLLRKKSDYKRSLNILKYVKEIDKNVITKTSIMVGLGETNKEIIDTLKDIKDVSCDIVTIGQYLRPSINHAMIKRYVALDEFKNLEDIAYNMGFKSCVAGPYVRSSYKAGQIFKNLFV